MRFKELVKHLEGCPLVAGATRKAWNGAAHVVHASINGSFELYLVIDGTGHYRYAFSLEDATADDWEPV